MAKITNKIKVEVSKRNTFEAIVAKQNDAASRFLKITLCNCGEDICIPADSSTVVINFERADKQTKSFAGVVNADGTVTVPLTSWALEISDIVRCSVTVYGTDEEKLTSTTFWLDVEKAEAAADDDVSDDENYGILVSLMSDCNVVKSACTDAAATANTAAANANTKAQEANIAAYNANSNANNAYNAASAANAAATAATEAANDASSAVGSLSSAFSAVNLSVQKANAATASATSAAEAANTAATNAQNVNITAEQTATGADITVTDRTGAETTVHIDTLMSVNSWNDVKNAVRLGLGEKLFPVGYEFKTLDSSTGSDITWVVVAHDHHTAANTKLTHTMTLEAKHVYSQSSGAYLSFQFDAPEALYYAANGLTAGTYHFTLAAGHDTSHGGGKTLSFTLAKPVPTGGIIMFQWSENQQSTAAKISTYASQTDTTAIETVSVTESAAGTNLGTADGTTPNMNYTPRCRLGSNNYAQSPVRQWLNSGEDVGEVWTPSTVFDRPPTWAAGRAGFMNGLPADFLAAVEPAVIPCRTNSVFETNSLDGTELETDQLYTLKDKFFSLSRPEIYGTWDSTSLKDGEQLEYYADTTDTERIKYDVSGTARSCWLRSPYSSSPHHERDISYIGAIGYTQTSYLRGITPACIIA